MIVGIDYTAAVWQGAGIGRYTRELIRSAVAMGGNFRYVLFYAAGGLSKQSPYVAALRQLCATYRQVRPVALPLSPRKLTILWQRLQLPIYIEYFTGKLDIVHAPDFVLPPTHARTLLTIHDLIFLLFPQFFELPLYRHLARVVPRSVKRANLILADSHSTRGDLIRLLNTAAERIVVIYPGVSPRFQPLPKAITEPIRERLGLPASFLLFVGTLEPRKNLPRLLESYKMFLDNTTMVAPPHLLITGRKGWLFEDIFATVERLHLTPYVQFLDFVDDELLPTLYNLADAFVYPSLYEGFGLPVAEALACGTPVLTSSTASLPEVVGQAGIIVNPLDHGAIAEGIAHMLKEQDCLRLAGPVQSQRFCWEQSARALLACYLRVAEG